MYVCPTCQSSAPSPEDADWVYNQHPLCSYECYTIAIGQILRELEEGEIVSSAQTQDSLKFHLN